MQPLLLRGTVNQKFVMIFIVVGEEPWETETQALATSK